MKQNTPYLAGMLALLLGACGGGNDSSEAASPTNGSPGGTPATSSTALAKSIARGPLPYGGALPAASCAKQENVNGGRSFRVQIPSRVDGAPIVFQVFEPDSIACNAKHALILDGHGYAGSRKTSKDSSGLVSMGAPVADLTADGFAVISIDQRGHGESGGTVRIMDPEYEGKDLVAIVDWATQHLDYLLYRDGNMVLGAMGGSYGGGYQMLLYATDPDERLDAIAPEITWNDLGYSLNPGNVVKSYWALFLAGAGELGSKLRQDPMIRSTLLDGALNNTMPGAALPFLNSHSPSYFCDNPLGIELMQAGNTQNYLLDPVTRLLPITANGHYIVKTPPMRAIRKIDALVFQGMRDDLFNFNEAWRNVECLKRGGGDVRLLTYEYGHHFISPNTGLLLEALNTASLPLSRRCGKTDAGQAIRAWFREKLQHQGRADDAIQTGSDVCFSLTMNDAVRTPNVKVGGEKIELRGTLNLPITVPIASPLPTVVPLKTIGRDGDVLAGIPTASLTVSHGLPALDALCLKQGLPLLHLGECDSTVFAGIGVIRSSQLLPLVPELIDEQVMPLRGIGNFEVQLVGVAERLKAGDKLVLLLYGLQDGFVATSSRDLTTPAVTVTGSVSLPLHGPLPNLNRL